MQTATPSLLSARTLKARERSREWRQNQQKQGLCPKHGNAQVSRLECCYQCHSNDEQLSGLKAGDLLKACFLCKCGRYYHEGSIYNYQPPESPRKKHGIQPGPNNSLFNYDDRKPGDPDKVSSLCGECRKEGGGKWQYHNHVTWKGRCSKHRGLGRLETERWRHGSDAIVLPSMRSSEPGVRKRMVKVAFICANRKKTIYGRHLGETYLSQTKRDEWRGLCSECLRRVVPPKKKLEDFSIEDVMDLLFSQANKKGVPIRYKVCGHERTAPRQTALCYRIASLKGERVPRGVCAECVKNPAAMLQARESNGQKNTGAKKRGVGRPRSTDAKQTLNDIQRTVLSLKTDGHSRRSATSNRVASLLGNSSPTSGDAMMKQVKKGIRIEWPALRDLIWDGGCVESLELIPVN